MILQLFDMDLNLVAELTVYSSLQMSRSYGGIGKFELHSHPNAPNVDLIKEDMIIMPVAKPNKAFLVEDIELEQDKLLIRGCQLKGIAKRRICVPPLNLPTKLWKYTLGSWVEISDPEKIKLLISEDIMQGYEKPTAVVEGLIWLDLKDIATVYNWENKAQTGEVWLDLERAQVRSKYKNFGYDRFTGSGESALHHYFKGNLVSTEDAGRNIVGLICASDLNRGTVLPWQARFDKLEELLEKISETTGIGWDVYPDLESKKLIFKTIQGNNLADDVGVGRVIISIDMGNAENMKLNQVGNSFINTMYTGGSGEDEGRMILAVAEGDMPVGIERREGWTEAGSSDDIELLRMSGLKALKGKGKKITIRSDILQNSLAEYEVDWDVGDIVKIEFNAGSINASADLRINEVREIVEIDKATRLQINFGDSPVTINSLVKSFSKGVIR